MHFAVDLKKFCSKARPRREDIGTLYKLPCTKATKAEARHRRRIIVNFYHLFARSKVPDLCVYLWDIVRIINTSLLRQLRVPTSTCIIRSSRCRKQLHRLPTYRLGDQYPLSHNPCSKVALSITQVCPRYTRRQHFNLHRLISQIHSAPSFVYQLPSRQDQLCAMMDMCVTVETWLEC